MILDFVVYIPGFELSFWVPNIVELKDFPVLSSRAGEQSYTLNWSWSSFVLLNTEVRFAHILSVLRVDVSSSQVVSERPYTLNTLSTLAHVIAQTFLK